MKNTWKDNLVVLAGIVAVIVISLILKGLAPEMTALGWVATIFIGIIFVLRFDRWRRPR